MDNREISLSCSISCADISGNIDSADSFNAAFSSAHSPTETDYGNLRNKPMINGVELVSDKSFEDLGDHVLTNFEILELMKNAGF